MSKLVDKERLAKLAKSLDARMKAAVAAEAERATGAEQALQTAINTINDAENGVLKQAEALVNAEKDRAMEAEGANAKAVEDEAAAARAEEQRIEGKADANAQDIAAINNADTGIAKVAADNLQAAKDELQGKIDLKVSQEAYDAKIAEIVGVNNTQNTDISDLQANVTQLKNQLGDGTFSGLQEAINGVTSAYQAADALIEAKADKAQEEVDAVEERVQALEDLVGNKAAEGVEAKGLCADVAKNAADIAAEAARAVAEEARIEGLVTAEANRADAEEKRIVGLVEAEANRADAAEKQVLVDAKAYTDEKVTQINEAAADLEARVLANENALKVVNGAADVDGSIAKAQADAQKYADDAITALVDSAPEAMNTLNELAEAIKAHGNEYEAYVATVAQDIATAKQEAIDAAAGKDDALKAELQDEIDADVKVEADRALVAEQALQTAVDAKVAQADYDVKVKALEDEDARIAGLVEDNADAIAAINDDENGILALAKKYADDQDVVVKNTQALVDQEQDRRLGILEGLVVGGEGEGLSAVIADVAANKTGVEKNANDIVALQAADTAFNTRVEALENANKEGGAVKDAIDAAQGAADKAQGDVDKLREEYDAFVEQVEADELDHVARIEALENANKEGGAVANAIQGVQDEVDAVEGRMDTAESKIDALQDFMNNHSHATLEQGIADNKAAAEAAQGKADDNEEAIAILNGGADVEGSVAKSIADALTPFINEQQVKTLLGNVVNSLALSMEDNKMMLKLGGVDGITIHETSLDMATDDDIDAIIAGLNEEEGQE